MFEAYIMKFMNRIKNSEFWGKLAKNVATVFLGSGGLAVINFILTILMSRMLGNMAYGIFLIAQQYMNLMDGIVNFQSWSGVIKYGSEAIVNDDNEGLYSIIKGGFIVDVTTAILGTTVALIAVPIARNILNWDYLQSLLALIFAIEIAFHVEGTSIGVLRLFDKFSYTAVQSIIGGLIKFIFIAIYFFTGGRSLLIVTLIYVITDIVKHLLLVFMAFKVIKTEVGISNIRKAPWRNSGNKAFYSYTVLNNISYTVDVPVKYFDIFIISFISVDMVAIYKVFQQIFQIITMITIPLSTAILPQFTELTAKQKLNHAYYKMIKIRDILWIIGGIILLLSGLFTKPILNLVYGQDYGNEWILFIVMLAVNLYLMAYVTIHPLMASLGKAKIDLEITLIGNVVYCVIAYILIGKIGIYAIIIARLISGMIVIYGKKTYIFKEMKEDGNELF